MFKNNQQIEYIHRINKVVEYIDCNLDKNLALKDLAEKACFSHFHFHRVFSAFLNETPNNYIVRRRIEKIANEIICGKNETITNLAYKYGFKSIHSFSRSFRKVYGMSATQFQKKSEAEFSKIGKIESNNGKKKVSFEKYFYTIDNLKKWLKMNSKVEVKEMPELKLIGVKHQGAYSKIGSAYEKLGKWAGPRGLLNFLKLKWIGIYYDSPRVTEESKMQSMACVEIKKEVEVSGEVTKITIPRGKFAVGRFNLKVGEFEKAWNSMTIWVMDNNFELRDGLFHEICHNDGSSHPDGIFIVDICIPVH